MLLGEMPAEAPDRSEASEAGHAPSDGGPNSGKSIDGWMDGWMHLFFLVFPFVSFLRGGKF